MKILFTRITFVSSFLFLFHISVKAQPDYTFNRAVHVSGTELQTGAMYKFSNVKTGIDAFVTITAQTGGIRLTDIDNKTTGFDEAFQPAIAIEKNSGGYVEFRIDFTDAATGTPKMQNVVPVTILNVDGAAYADGEMHEQDQVQFFPGYYDFSITGSKLEVNLPAGMVSVKNISGTRYAAIDTSAKDVMATVVNKNVTSFILRAGAINTSSSVSEVRIKSFYFKPFSYGHMNTLPNRTMLSFSGTKKQNFVELKGTLSASHSYDKMIIERAVSPNVFGSIEKMDISGRANAEFRFTFTDINPENGVNYYRIRLVGTNSSIQEISNTLMVKMDNNKKDLEIINTVVQGSNPVLTISSPADCEAELQVADLSGRIINSLKTKLNSGFNNISLSGFNTSKGYFVTVIRTKNKTISRKIMIQ